MTEPSYDRAPTIDWRWSPLPKQTFFNLPDEKRNHILDCAVAEFADKGYKLASISRIVASAGIAKGSFYQYFEDKDDLFMHIVTALIADRKKLTFEREKEHLEELTLTQFLRLVFHMQLKQFLETPQLMKIGLEFTLLAGEPIYQKIMQQYSQEYNTYFLPFIQHEVEQGEIDKRVNAQLLNFMLVSIGQYLLYQMQQTNNYMGINDRLIDILVDDLEFIFTNGIYTDLVKNDQPDNDSTQ